MPLNIAGPEYDFGSVVFVVLEECEHRRRGFDDDEAECSELLRVARGKLAKIKKAYDEFGGVARVLERAGERKSWRPPCRSTSRPRGR